jgi:SAM-dependent methyltransferase
MSKQATVWPKEVAELTDEQIRIRDDFMKYFHEIYSTKYSAVANFSHGYPLESSGAGVKTLDVGAGLGEHLDFEDAQKGDYYALELRDEMAAVIKENHPEAETAVGDIEQGLDFKDGTFDRVIAIHVLEHLPNLPAALDEVHRVLRPGGVFEVVIPCEDGLGYSLGRRLTTQRVFEKRYGVPYRWYIKSEHVNVPKEIVGELEARFERTRRSFYPLKIPSVNANLCIGLSYRRD